MRQRERDKETSIQRKSVKRTYTKREREAYIERGSEIDRQTQTHSQRERDIGRERERERKKHTDTHTHRKNRVRE